MPSSNGPSRCTADECSPAAATAFAPAARGRQGHPVSTIEVLVLAATGPRHVAEARLRLAAGTRLGDVLRQCTALPQFAGLDLAAMPAGIWGRRVNPQRALRDGDRIELYRPLQVDPKVARRERFAQQGARTAGLFATRRKGAKAGY